MEVSGVVSVSPAWDFRRSLMISPRSDSLKKEYESLAGRNQEIDDTFISLYADKAKGILTEKRFLKLTEAMEKEQEKNQNRMQEIAMLISEEEHISETMSAVIQQMWLLLTLNFQALKCQEIQSFSHVRAVVVSVSSSCLLQSVWSI